MRLFTSILAQVYTNFFVNLVKDIIVIQMMLYPTLSQVILNDVHYHKYHRDWQLKLHPRRGRGYKTTPVRSILCLS